MLLRTFVLLLRTEVRLPRAQPGENIISLDMWNIAKARHAALRWDIRGLIRKLLIICPVERTARELYSWAGARS